MKKSKFLGSLLLTSLLAAGHSAAFADEANDAFLQELDSLSPNSAKVVRAIDSDIKESCGFEPSLAQNRMIADNSEAFTYRLAVTVLANGDATLKKPEDKAHYAEYLKKLNCFKAANTHA